MRKVAGLTILALALAALTAGVLFAQDSTATGGGWLGVAISEQNGEVVIARVQAGSPANAAGLLIGDVIVSFNGDAISSASDLVAKVRAAAPGDTVSLEVLRNGASQTVEVTLGSAVQVGRAGRAPVTLDPLTWAQRLLNADLKAVDAGYEVVNVLASNNPFQLQIGDVVTAVNGQAVAELTPQGLAQGMMQSGKLGLTVTIQRNGEEITLEPEFDSMGMRFHMFPGFGLEFGAPHGFGQGFEFGQRGGRGMPRGFFFGIPDPQPQPDQGTQHIAPSIPAGAAA